MKECEDVERLTPQFSFQDGDLSISTPLRSYRIHGWPEPCAREKLGDGAWKNCRPEFRLVKPQLEVTNSTSGVTTPGEDDCGPELVRLPDAHDEKRMAFEAFRSQLPEGVAP